MIAYLIFAAICFFISIVVMTVFDEFESFGMAFVFSLAWPFTLFVLLAALIGECIRKAFKL